MKTDKLGLNKSKKDIFYLVNCSSSLNCEKHGKIKYSYSSVLYIQYEKCKIRKNKIYLLTIYLDDESEGERSVKALAGLELECVYSIPIWLKTRKEVLPHPPSQ